MQSSHIQLPGRCSSPWGRSLNRISREGRAGPSCSRPGYVMRGQFATPAMPRVKRSIRNRVSRRFGGSLPTPDSSRAFFKSDLESRGAGRGPAHRARRCGAAALIGYPGEGTGPTAAPGPSACTLPMPMRLSPRRDAAGPGNEICQADLRRPRAHAKAGKAITPVPRRRYGHYRLANSWPGSAATPDTIQPTLGQPRAARCAEQPLGGSGELHQGPGPWQRTPRR